MPSCDLQAAGSFREMPLCKPHLEIMRTWEFFFGGPVRIPTVAELKQARGTREFAEYALDYFLDMNVKYGAVDFYSGSMAYNCQKFLQKEIRDRALKIWIFRRGANSYNQHEKATLYLVREDFDKTEALAR